MGLFDSVENFVVGKAKDVGGSIVKAVPLPSAVKSFGQKIANSKALRIGEKIAGGAVRIGHKMTQVGDAVHSVTGKAVSLTSGIPILGAAVGIADKAAMGASGLGRGVSTAGSAAQGVIRVGRSMGSMKTGGDLISSVRDLSRASQKMGGATSNLVSQARSVGTSLQRRK